MEYQLQLTSRLLGSCLPSVHECLNMTLGIHAEDKGVPSACLCLSPSITHTQGCTHTQHALCMVSARDWMQ